METKRIPWFDNIKGVLIFLVVFGHLIEVYRGLEGNETVKYLYDIIYFFHMPLFIMISGYLFRPNKLERILQLLGIFIIWQLLNGIISKFIQEQTFVSLTPESRIFSIFDPYWTLWYLLGIIVWSIITPYILKLRYPLIMSFLLAILITYTENVTSWFSLRKLVNFYPYFLIGYFLADKKILLALANKVNSWKMPIRWIALSTLFAFSVLMWYFTKLPKGTEILFMRESFSYFNWGFLKGAFIQIVMYMAVTLFSLSLLVFIPIKKEIPFFNKLGLYSVYIYLVHTNIVRLFREYVPPYIVESPIILISVSVVIAYMISWFISLESIRKVLKPLIEPSFKWILKLDNTSRTKRTGKQVA
jgi:fucose 4-O-acetylase-like acetyltransferase